MRTAKKLEMKKAKYSERFDCAIKTKFEQKINA